MLSSLFTRSLQDRWVGTAVGATLAGAFLILAMAAYQSVDITLYTDLPEGVRSVMGIPDDADAATLAYDIVLGLVAAMTLAGLAVSMGAASVAGEERDGTIGLLLANPRSRREVLVAKTTAMVSLVTAGTLVTLGASYLAPAVLDVDVGATHLLATNLHLLLNALVWGALACAVGAVTGNKPLAVAAATGCMVGSYFLAGLLPLADAGADVAKALPWYWFDGHDPLNGGVSPAYVALQVALIAVAWAVAWWGVEARDLTRPTGGAGVIAGLADRVRGNRHAARVVEQLSGGARVGSIWAKTTAEGQALVMIVGFVMFTMMGLLMGPMYAALESTLADVSADLPDNLLAVVGGGDLSSPEGWYRVESFGLMAPIAVTLVAATVGARALAGEERARTMGLLLANPVSRRRIVVEKLVALVVQTSAVGVAIFAGVAGGSLLGGLGMSFANIAAAALQATLLGVMFGTFALAAGAATGDVRVATVATLGVFAAAYAANAVLSIADGLEGWIRLTPFEWYLGDDPLVNGVSWTSVGLFVALTALLAVAAIAAFERRDLRRG